MIRKMGPEMAEYSTISVKTKDGAVYSHKDVPPNPFEVNNCVSFWVGDEVHVIPLERVAFIIFHNKPEKDQ